MAMRMPSLSSLLQPPIGTSIPGFLWNYLPRTSWFNHFITINKNGGDAPIEEHVLRSVGSYGMQLGEILDAVDVLIKLVPEAERNKLSNAEIGKLASLTSLHTRVKDAVTSG